MIKINLLRNRVQDTAVVGDAGASSVSSDNLREGIVKIAFVLLFTLGLMLYENQNIRSLNEEQARLQAQSTQMLAQNAAKEADVLKVKDIEIQAKELEDKLKILKLLSKLRLREVKTLDFMQSSIPEKVWLKAINYESDKVRVEAGHFQFSGNSVGTEELTEFVKRLDDSAYLMDVIVVKNQEVPVNKSTTMREFLFTAEVENQN